VLSESNIIMIVVDQLTKEEQRLVQKIKSIYEQSEIIIIHNLSKLVHLSDAEKYIKIDIEHSFEVTKHKLTFEGLELIGTFYVEKRLDAYYQALPDITHVIMAYEDSEAGRKFNPFCYHYLKNRLLTVTRAKKFDIVDRLMQMLQKQLPDIIDETADKLNEYQVVMVDNRSEDRQEKLITTNVKSKNLKSISFDLLGDLKVFKRGLDPKYSLSMQGDKLVLAAELPGPFKATPRDHESKNSLKRIITCPITKS
jgi:hypothetical protein